jgi:hypothetical protein
MFELLERLREKPDHTKKQIAFFLTVLIVGFIFVIWLSVIYPDFKDKSLIDDKVSKLEPSPLGTFSETFKTGISAIGEQVTQLKESVSTIVTDFASSSVGTSTSEQ